MYVLEAGRLRKKISIYGYVEQESALGGYDVRLAKKCDCWAELKPVRGLEFLEYYRETNTLSYKITIRYRRDISEKDVIVYGNRQFEINSVININEDNIALEIYCTERKDKVIM